MITIIFIALILIDLICIGRESFAAATLLTLATFGGIWIFSHNPFIWILANPAMFGYLVAAYLFVGFFYSQWKYKRFLVKKKACYIGNPDGWKLNKSDFSPKAKSSDIIGWLFWWPFSLIGYMVSDLLTDFGKWVFNRIAGWFNNIFKKIDESTTETNS